jgi:putative transposase
MAEHMRTELVTNALDMAARNHRLAADCVFHSDHGTQYTSTEFATTLDELGLRQSLGRTRQLLPKGLLVGWPEILSVRALQPPEVGFRRSPGVVPWHQYHSESTSEQSFQYDNALAESFFATLKNERVHRTVYPTRKKAKEDIARYIETFYNRRRLHSALDYRTPHEVRSESLNRQLAAWTNAIQLSGKREAAHSRPPTTCTAPTSTSNCAGRCRPTPKKNTTKANY